MAQVRDIVADINAKVKANGAEQADLSAEFNELRKLTNNYEVPSDG
ncbi:hypothetical protein ACDX78_04935 [Virgibacillus oceani]